MSRSVGAKVAVLGAAGGIGQCLSLLLKLSPEIDEVACYDVVNSPGVAADLSHIPTSAKVTGYLPSPLSWPPSGNTGLSSALSKADLVVIPAGVPRKPGMSRDDLFNTNAGIVQTLVEGCAEHCPEAMLVIISNPVNSTVPIAAEVLKKYNVYDPNKLFGVTALDVLRANTFLAHSQGWNPAHTNVTVIGGHAGITILPLFSQVQGANLSQQDIELLTVKTQFGGDDVVKAKAGAGSATLSMAYAGYLFTQNILKALKGQPDIVQCAFVQSHLTEAPFFASPVKLGKSGIEQVLPFGDLSPYENQSFQNMMPELKTQIQKGIDFVFA